MNLLKQVCSESKLTKWFDSIQSKKINGLLNEKNAKGKYVRLEKLCSRLDEEDLGQLNKICLSYQKGVSEEFKHWMMTFGKSLWNPFVDTDKNPPTNGEILDETKQLLKMDFEKIKRRRSIKSEKNIEMRKLNKLFFKNISQIHLGVFFCLIGSGQIDDIEALINIAKSKQKDESVKMQQVLSKKLLKNIR